MDCGPGTVFNPAIMVCDWPRNVKGCEGKKIFKIIKIENLLWIYGIFKFILFNFLFI